MTLDEFYKEIDKFMDDEKSKMLDKLWEKYHASRPYLPNDIIYGEALAPGAFMLYLNKLGFEVIKFPLLKMDEEE